VLLGAGAGSPNSALAFLELAEFLPDVADSADGQRTLGRLHKTITEKRGNELLNSGQVRFMRLRRFLE